MRVKEAGGELELGFTFRRFTLMVQKSGQRYVRVYSMESCYMITKETKMWIRVDAISVTNTLTM